MMTSSHRGHAALLAMGAPLDRTFGELLGRAYGL
jgi:pyruvate dehydrogenase E1 component alpha subunit